MVPAQKSSAGGSLRIAWAAAFIVGVAFSAPLLADPAPGGATYRLSPGDRITVTVFGQTDLSGDLLIDDAGNISLPLVQSLNVKGLTVAECQNLIRERLADGVLRQPTVSVRISELRPLYILGDVRTPGAYPYRYGVTAKSAVALAGGFGLNEPLQSTAVSEFLIADERVRQMTFQKQALLVRRARLEAQRDGLSSFSPPPMPQPNESTEIAAIVTNEKETFEAQSTILHEQLELMRSQKPRLLDEIKSHKEQIDAGNKQLRAIKQEDDRIAGLVKQGLVTQSMGFQLKITEANQEMNVWRLMGEVSRLQVSLGEFELKIQEVETTFRKQAVTELRDIREHLNELEATLPVARQIRDVRLQYVGGVINTEVERTLTLTRVHDGQSTTSAATENTSLQPGDILEVKRLLPPGAAPKAVSLVRPSPQPYQVGAGDPAPMKSVPQ